MQDALQAAMRQHQLGQLQEAGRMYQNILARNPNHSDALHLLGVVAHQLGHHPQAAELIGRAIALRAASGRLSRQSRRSLADAGPADARSSLAAPRCVCSRISRRRRTTWDCRCSPAAICRSRSPTSAPPSKLSPDFAMAYNNLANGLRLQGDMVGAIAYFREAVRRDPQDGRGAKQSRPTAVRTQ